MTTQKSKRLLYKLFLPAFASTVALQHQTLSDFSPVDEIVKTVYAAYLSADHGSGVVY